MSGFWIAAFLVLASFVAIQGLLVLGLLRRFAPVLERAEGALGSASGGHGGLSPGAKAPPFELRSANGGKLTSSQLAGRPYVLLFVRSGCAPCKRLAEEIRVSGEDPASGVELVVVANDAAGGMGFLDGPRTVILHQADDDVSRAFATTATPHAFAIDSSETVVATGYPNTLKQLQALAREARKEVSEASTPELTLHRLEDVS
jgi:thiol-disulfide isomerase/thioredoxin